MNNELKTGINDSVPAKQDMAKQTYHKTAYVLEEVPKNGMTQDLGVLIPSLVLFCFSPSAAVLISCMSRDIYIDQKNS